MTSYWLIKALLILALIAITVVLMRPSRSASSLALRRIGMLLVLVAAVFAILFPGLFNTFAHAVGVSNGTNLLVYLLTIALFTQIASSYRRDTRLDQRLTILAREVALNRGALREATGRDPHPELTRKDEAQTGEATVAPRNLAVDPRDPVETAADPREPQDPDRGAAQPNEGPVKSQPRDFHH